MQLDKKEVAATTFKQASIPFKDGFHQGILPRKLEYIQMSLADTKWAW